MPLKPAELQRYARHLLLPEVGPAGQKKLLGSSVLCVGAGGLGSPTALYLAAAGVGRLGIVDSDRVDLSNLQRQVLHRTADVGRLKTESARETLQALNPHVNVEVHDTRLAAANALDLLKAYDLIVDGSDNFPTRYLVNDACVLLGRPNVYGAVQQFEGQASVFAPHLGGPCYRCLYPDPPPPGAVPSCAEAGVLGVLPGLIGMIQATETLKLLLGQGEPLLGRLLVYHALDMRFRELQLRRDPECPLCGPHPTVTALVDYEQLCGGTAPVLPAADPESDEVSVHDLKRALEEPSLGIVVLDVREEPEIRSATLPGTVAFPLSGLRARLDELDPAQSYYLYCRSGMRSLQALQFLRAQGFARLKNVTGGLLAWAQEIDPDLSVR